MERPKGFMMYELHERLVDQCAQWGVQEINLQFLGEPLLDKLLLERIRYAKQRGLKIRMTTNGSLITPDRAEALIESGIDHVTISFDGFTKETFESIRIGLQYDKVYEGTMSLIAKKLELKSSTPEIELCFVGLAENESEATQFLNYWKDKVDEVIVSNATDWAGNLTLEKLGPYCRSDIRRPPCRHLWEEMIVLQDGRVTVCCQSYDGQLLVGDAKRQSLKEIWTGEEYQKLRRAHLERKFDQVPYCADCKVRTDWW
jgi:radical SAM protein with 4Fe4S-binding SPASM domain